MSALGSFIEWVCPICFFSADFPSGRSFPDSVKCPQCGVQSPFLENSTSAVPSENFDMRPSSPLKDDEDLKPVAGLSSIMQRVDLNMKQSQKELDRAFVDLESLMSKASDMVQLADRITKQISSTKTEMNPSEAHFISNFFLSMGIESPVTKAIVGTDYHVELTKELLKLLPNVISSPESKSKEKPCFIALADLYCIWNRARGTALVSPGDLVHVVSYIPKLSSQYIVKKFQSGLITLTHRSNSDEFILEKIRKLFYLKPSEAFLDSIPYQERICCYSSLEFSKLENISVIIAKEHLLMAEHCGIIVMDESVEGIVYYPNLIKT